LLLDQGLASEIYELVVSGDAFETTCAMAMPVVLDEGESAEGDCADGNETVLLIASRGASGTNCFGTTSNRDCVAQPAEEQPKYQLVVYGTHDLVSIVVTQSGGEVGRLLAQPSYEVNGEGCMWANEPLEFK
jgi:hypothetical protein